MRRRHVHPVPLPGEYDTVLAWRIRRVQARDNDLNCEEWRVRWTVDHHLVFHGTWGRCTKCWHCDVCEGRL